MDNLNNIYKSLSEEEKDEYCESYKQRTCTNNIHFEHILKTSSHLKKHCIYEELKHNIITSCNHLYRDLKILHHNKVRLTCLRCNINIVITNNNTLETIKDIPNSCAHLYEYTQHNDCEKNTECDTICFTCIICHHVLDLK